MATNRVYKGYSRFRHIKKRRSWESTGTTIDTPFPLGMECLCVIWRYGSGSAASCGNQPTSILRRGFQPQKTAAGCDNNPAYARHTLLDVNSNSYQRISAENGRCASIAVFCIHPRAPPLLKFWLSQNFKRLEESVMGFNCAQEKAKFDREWLRLRKEYTDAGMSEAAIQKIYDYDWYCFCRNRAYERRATQMPPLEIDSPDDARRSALFRKNETLSVSFDESAFPDRYAWVDTLEDLRLLQAIKTLSIEELEILTFLTLEEHSQKELAERWGCSQRAISKKFQKIKKIFQKWF